MLGPSGRHLPVLAAVVRQDVTVLTEKRNTWRVRPVEGVTVFCKVLGATHEFAHALQCAHGTLIDRSPRPIETMDWCCSEGRDDRR